MRKEDVVKLVELNNELLKKSKVILNLFDEKMSQKIKEYRAKPNNQDFITLLMKHRNENPFNKEYIVLLQDFYDEGEMTVEDEGVRIYGRTSSSHWEDDVVFSFIPFNLLAVFDDKITLEQEITDRVETHCFSIIRKYEEEMIEKAKLKEERAQIEQSEEYKQWQELNKRFGLK